MRCLLNFTLGLPMDPHRESCRRQHRVLGHFLAIQAWLRGLDCIVLLRQDLETFLGLERFKMQRVNWLVEDLKPWFPHPVPLNLAKAPSSLWSIFLSRVPIQEWLPSGTMTIEQLIGRMSDEAPKTECFAKLPKGHRRPTEADVVRFLAVLDSGLSEPEAFSSVPIGAP